MIYFVVVLRVNVGLAGLLDHSDSGTYYDRCRRQVCRCSGGGDTKGRVARRGRAKHVFTDRENGNNFVVGDPTIPR